jgi:transposase InsO family protein
MERLFMASAAYSDHLKQHWYVDSGATQHMTCQKEWFQTFESIPPRQVALGDDYVLEAVGRGEVLLKLESGDNQELARLTEVLFVPDLTVNLLSVRRLVDRNIRVEFDAESSCLLKTEDGKEVLARTMMDCNLYRLLASVVQPKETAAAASAVETTIWHERFGHLGEQNLNQLSKKKLVDGLPNLDLVPVQPCGGCLAGKQHKHPFNSKPSVRAKQPLQLIHSDLCGPMQTPSLGKALYFLSLIDDFSRYTFVYFLETKSQCLEKFLAYKRLVENQTERTIKELRTDRGGEYVNGKFLEVLADAGVKAQRTTPRTPQQNGVAERANRTIVESARSMLHGRSVPLRFWAEAVATAVYLKNRSPTVAVRGATPYEAWFGRKPGVAHLRVFGCQAFAC